MKIGVIGGGAAGMVAAVFAARAGADVTLFEKNEKLGKKLYITGKGRCNVTNLCPVDAFLGNVVHGDKFLRSALYSFTPQSAYEFFEQLGVLLKTERGNRVFPVSDKSSDVIKALVKELERLKVRVLLNTAVKKIKPCSTPKTDSALTDNSESGSNGFLIYFENDFQSFDKVIVATGGKSYPSTGSTGDGYVFARSLGLDVCQPRPALVAIVTKEDVSSLQGISLKNVRLTAYAENGKELYSDFGEMLFTKNGISGPIALSVSSHINREENVALSLDLKPALDSQKLENRILRDFEERKNQDIKNAARSVLPERLNTYVLSRAEIDCEKKVNSITKDERRRLVSSLKDLRLHVLSLASFEEAVVTAGGVNLKELKPDCECKTVEGLFFCGEVIDADALTGGFNLQIAYSTAVAAANSAVSR
jgi:predicted Rossmann fold flavoprotein